jgi:hypothetical protein
LIGEDFLLSGPEDIVPQYPIHPVGEKELGPFRHGLDGREQGLGGHMAFPENELPSQGDMRGKGPPFQEKTLLPESQGQPLLALAQRGTGIGGEIADAALKEVQTPEGEGNRSHRGRFQSGEGMGEKGVLHLTQKGQGEVKVARRSKIPFYCGLFKALLSRKKLPLHLKGEGKSYKEPHIM